MVEVLGYGGGDGGAPDQNEDDKRRPNTGQMQSDQPTGMFRVIGNGQLTEEQNEALTPDERRRKAAIEGGG
jgi:hypothetical protein